MSTCVVRVCSVYNEMFIIFMFIFQVITLKSVSAYHRDYMMAYIPVEEYFYLAGIGFDVTPVPQYTSPFTYSPMQGSYFQNWYSGYPPPTGPVYGGYGSGSGNSGLWNNPNLPTTPATLPTITSLPPVSLPRPPVVPPPMPSTLPSISTVTTLNDASKVNEPLSFSGKVKASGGVKIYANFC